MPTLISSCPIGHTKAPDHGCDSRVAVTKLLFTPKPKVDCTATVLCAGTCSEAVNDALGSGDPINIPIKDGYLCPFNQ